MDNIDSTLSFEVGDRIYYMNTAYRVVSIPSNNRYECKKIDGRKKITLKMQGLTTLEA